MNGWVEDAHAECGYRWVRDEFRRDDGSAHRTPDWYELHNWDAGREDP